MKLSTISGRLLVLLALVSSFCGVSKLANAAIAPVTGEVNRILVVEGDLYGGCMIQITTPLASAGVDCRGNWVSFSCTGDFTTKDVAYKMLETAQLAYALGERVTVFADDSRQHNNWCFANRIDLRR